MYIDGRRIDDGSTLQADVCIVGGGPAGITVARELVGSSLSAVLVESGGMRRDRSVQSLNRGEVPDGSAHPPADMYRDRRFGGSSAIWGGRCVPLMPSDFAVRPYVANSGWPFGYEDLLPYYHRAMPYCEAGTFAFDSGCLRSPVPLIDALPTDDIAVRVERFSPPTNFGKRHAACFARSTSQKIVLSTTGIRLLADQSGRRIERLECATLGGNRFAICARYFVIAAGGLESVRLLAASAHVNSAHANNVGLANSSGLLGHYYMSHLEGTLGTLRVATDRRIAWNFEMTADGIYAKRHMRLSEDVQRKHRLRDLIIRLHHANPMDPDHGDPVLSLMYIAKRFILPEYRRKIATVELDALKRLPPGPALLARHAENIVRQPWPLLRFLTSWVYRRHARYRRIPYVALHSKAGVYPLDYNAEQTPLRDSRVVFLPAQDRFGMPKLRIEWRACPEDIESIAGSFRLLKSALARTGAATIEIDEHSLLEKAQGTIPVGGHHIGTARMSDDPRRGVVNPECRAHDLDNLYVASSAVFPTSGSANPTLTIVALAIRIADRLRAAAKSASRSAP